MTSASGDLHPWANVGGGCGFRSILVLLGSFLQCIDRFLADLRAYWPLGRHLGVTLGSNREPRVDLMWNLRSQVAPFRVASPVNLGYFFDIEAQQCWKHYENPFWRYLDPAVDSQMWLSIANSFQNPCRQFHETLLI